MTPYNMPALPSLKVKDIDKQQKIVINDIVFFIANNVGCSVIRYIYASESFLQMLLIRNHILCLSLNRQKRHPSGFAGFSAFQFLSY